MQYPVAFLQITLLRESRAHLQKRDGDVVAGDKMRAFFLDTLSFFWRISSTKKINLSAFT